MDGDEREPDAGTPIKSRRPQQEGDAFPLFHRHDGDPDHAGGLSPQVNVRGGWGRDVITEWNVA